MSAVERITLEQAFAVADTAVKRFVGQNRWAETYREEALQVARMTAWLCRANYKPALNLNERAYIWGAVCRQIVREVYSLRLGLGGAKHDPSKVSAAVFLVSIEDPNNKAETLRAAAETPESEALHREELAALARTVSAYGVTPLELIDGVQLPAGPARKARVAKVRAVTRELAAALR